MIHLIGLIAGFVIIGFGVMSSGGSLMAIIDIPSIILVFVGSFTALVIVYPMSAIKKIPKLYGQLMKESSNSIVELIKTFEDLSTKARKDGVLALEAEIEQIEDEFLKNGLRLVVDGTEADQIKSILNTEIESLDTRHSQNQEMISKWGTFAPAFGMMGTVIGLIVMLGNLAGGADELGTAMAVAFITTLYGSAAQNILFDPIAANLRGKTDKEILFREIMLEGIIMIQNGTNPRMITANLMTYLSPDERAEMGDSNNGE